MTDVKENWLDEILYGLQQPSKKSYPGEKAKRRVAAHQAILEEMDRVVAEVLGEHQVISTIPAGGSVTFIDEYSKAYSQLLQEQRHRWQEVRGRL